MALRYASGEKVTAIAAAFACTNGYVTKIAQDFALRRRGHGCREAAPNPADVEHLRRWARNKASTLERRAADWRVLAELE